MEIGMEVEMDRRKERSYLKLYENFYKQDEIALLESFENGYLYSNILMKMYCYSLQYGGRVMYSEYLPHTDETIAKLTGHDISIVKSALEKFKELKLAEQYYDGRYHMVGVYLEYY